MFLKLIYRLTASSDWVTKNEVLKQNEGRLAVWYILRKHSFLIVSLAAFLSWYGMDTLPPSNKSVQGSLNQGTVPTRTPTPADAPPTNTQRPESPGNGEPKPTETATSQIADTATATSVVLVETPIGGYLPTAENCGVPPTVQALDLVNVRAGPGVAYEPIDRLVYLEVRPIVGRATYANWWLIGLPDGTLGWVVDNVVVVTGNIGVVPEVKAPPIDGATPTRGTMWRPTITADCQPLPTFTALPSSTATRISAEDDVTPTAQATKLEATLTESPPAPEVDTSTTATAIENETPDSTGTERAATATPASSLPSPTTSNVEDDQQDEANGEGSSWLLFIGLGLILLGVVVYVASRIIG